MKSRISLKRRILSAGLAIAMLLSFVPETLISKVFALTFEKEATLTVDSDGSYMVKYATADTGASISGDDYFILVPDIGLSPAGTLATLITQNSSGAVETYLANYFDSDTFNTVVRIIRGDDNTKIPISSGVVSIVSANTGDFRNLEDLGTIIAALKSNTATAGGVYVPEKNDKVSIDSLKDTGVPYVAILYHSTDPGKHNIATDVYKATVVGKSNLRPSDYVRNQGTTAFAASTSGTNLQFANDTTWEGTVTNIGDGNTIFQGFGTSLLETRAQSNIGITYAADTTSAVKLCRTKGDLSSALSVGDIIEAGNTYYVALAPDSQITAVNMPATGYVKVLYQDAGAKNNSIVVVPVRINGSNTSNPGLSISSVWITGKAGSLTNANITSFPYMTPWVTTAQSSSLATVYSGPYMTKTQVKVKDHVKNGQNADDTDKQWIKIISDEILTEEQTIAYNSTDYKIATGRDLKIELTEEINKLGPGLYVETLEYKFQRVNKNAAVQENYAYFTVYIEIEGKDNDPPTLNRIPGDPYNESDYIANSGDSSRTNPVFTYTTGSWGNITGVTLVATDGTEFELTPSTDYELKDYSAADGTGTLELKNGALDLLGLSQYTYVTVKATYAAKPDDGIAQTTSASARMNISGSFPVKITVTADVENYSHGKITLRDSAGNSVDVNTGSGPWSVGSTKKNNVYTTEYTYDEAKVGTKYTVWIGDAETTKEVTVDSPNATLNFRSVTAKAGTGAGKVGIGTTAAVAQAGATDGSDKTLTRLVENKTGSAVYLYAQPDSSHGGDATWEYTGTSGGTSGDAVSISALVATTVTPTVALASYKNKYTVTAVAGAGAATASASPTTVLDGGTSTLSASPSTGYDGTTLTWTLTKTGGGTATTAAPVSGVITPKEDVTATASYPLIKPTISGTNVTTNGGKDGKVTLTNVSDYPNTFDFELVDNAGNAISNAPSISSGVFTGTTTNPVPAGTYRVKVTDPTTGVSATSDQVTLGEPGAATVTVKLDGQGKDGLTLVATPNGGGSTITVTASTSGVYTFDTLVTGKDYTVSLGGSSGALGTDWKQSTTKATINSSDKNDVTINFYTITTKTSTSTASVYVDGTKTTGVYQSGTTFTATATAATGYGGNATWSTAQPATAGTVCTAPDATASGTATAAVTVTGTTEITATFPINKVTVQINLNGSKDTGDTMALGTDSITLKDTTFKGTPSGGAVTFEGVPVNSDGSDKAYTILVGGKDTGLPVTAKAGVNDGSGTTTRILYYYTIQVQNSNTAGGSATAQYGSGSAVTATATAQDVCTILANAGDTFNSRTVNTTATKTNNTFNIGWTADKTAGDTSKGTNGWTTPTAAASTWTLATTYTGVGPIILDPKFADNGKYVGTVTVNHNGSPEQNDTVELYVGSVSTTNKVDTQTTDANGKVSFDGLEDGKTYIAVVKNGSTTYNGTGTITKSKKDIILNYFDVTVAEGTGALASSAAVRTTNTGTGADTMLTFLEGQTAYLKSSADTAAGYGGNGTWKSNVDGQTAGGTGKAGTYEVHKQVTFTAEYAPNTPTASTTNLTTYYGHPGVDHTGATISMTDYTGNFTTTIPDADKDAVEALGLTLTVSADGKTIKVTGRPHEVTTSAVTVNFTATASNNESVTSSFTITVNKYNSTITATPTSGNHYENDTTSDALTVTVNDGNKGPYYNGTEWIEIGKTDIDAAGALTFTPANLPANGKVTVDIGGYQSGTGHDLSDVWDDTKTEPTVPIATTGPVTVNVTLDGGHYPAMVGKTVKLQQSNVDKKTDTLAADNATTPTKATVKIPYVPAGSYDIVVDGDKVKTQSFSTSAGMVVDVPYFSWEFHDNLGTDTAHTASGMPSTLSGVILSGRKLTGTAPTRTGYQFKGWGTAPNATSDLWNGTTERTISGTSNFYAIWAPNVVTVTVTSNGAADVTRAGKVTLVGTGTTTGTVNNPGSGSITTGGKVTFNAVPAGTYKICVDGNDTGHPNVTVTVGGTVDKYLTYYTVEVKAPQDASGTAIAGGAATIDTKASVELLKEGTKNSAALSSSKTDDNYAFTKWKQTLKTTTGTEVTYGTVPATETGNYTLTKGLTTALATADGPIVLTPIYTKNKGSLKVTVKVDGTEIEDATVTLTNSSGVAASTPVTATTNDNGVATFNGLTAGKYYAKSDQDSGANFAASNPDVSVAADGAIALNYVTYTFNGNKPDAATATVSTPPADGIMMVGKNIDWPGGVTLTGYTFQGWNTNKDNATAGTATWKANNAYTVPSDANKKITFYAAWTPIDVTLTAMTAKGARGLDGIIEVTGGVADGGGGTSVGDYTYAVESTQGLSNDGLAHGITVTPLTDGSGRFSVTGTPDAVGEIKFTIKATSKLNGESKTATLTVTVEEVYTVEYAAPGALLKTGHDTLPTDNNKYTESGKTYGSTATLNKITADTSGEPQWSGDLKTLGGWALTDGAAAGEATFNISDAKTKANATTHVITLYAVWQSGSLGLKPGSMNAKYNMTKAQWDADSTCSASELDISSLITKSSNDRTLTLSNVPDFMEYDADTETLKMKGGTTRVGEAGTYTITVTLKDNSIPEAADGDAKNPITTTVTVTVAKTTPVIMKSSTEKGLATTGGPTYYKDDLAWDVMTYYEVQDPYEPTKVLSATADKETHKSRWANTAQKITAGTTDYTFTYTDTNTRSYNTASDKITLTAVERKISLQVKDDNKVGGTWTDKFENVNSQNFDPDGTWETIKVNIRNPFGNNSPVTTLTATPTKGATASSGTYTATDSAFRNITVTSVAPLAVGADANDAGSLILQFEVNKQATGSGHTLAFKFDGAAGPASGGSRKTASATYTYTLNVGSSQLDTPEPTLSRVEQSSGNNGPFKGTDKGGNPVDPDKGGLHLKFPAISQEEETPNPVKEYQVTLTDGTKTWPMVTIKPDAIDEDGNYYYWWPVDEDKVNDLDPTKTFTVKVKAISADTNKYSDSGEGTDTEGPGRKKLTIDMITGNLTDMTFNGQQRSSSTAFGVPTGITASTIKVTYSNKADGTDRTATKLHVNMTETTTNPALTSDTLDHDYYIWVYVPESTYYLALGTEAAPVAYNDRKAGTTATTKKDGTRSTRTSPHENWEIVQAEATMPIVPQPPANKQTEEAVDLLGTRTPQTSYGTTATAGEYKNAQGYTTEYYDITYILASAPNTSTRWKSLEGTELTEAQMRAFKGDVGGSYKFTAKASYKTENFPKDMTEEQYNQFKADLTVVEKDFTFTIGARTIKSIDLLRFEAVNGGKGTDKDTGDYKDENRPVTYGTAVEKGATATSANGYYDATDRNTSKQMRLEGLKVVVTYSNNTTDEYVVGTDDLPGDFVWVSSNAGVTAPAITDFDLDFNGADISTNLLIQYGTGTIKSNTVTYTMAKRVIDYKVVSDDEKVWNNNSKVNGKIEFELPENLDGDDVKIAVNGDQFQTTNVKYKDWEAAGSKPYGVNEAYSTSSVVGKDKVVRAQKVGNSGSGSDVTGDDKAFYKRGTEIPGVATIKPSLVTKLDVKQPEPSAATTPTGNNSVNNSKYNSSISSKEDEMKIGSNWSLTPSTSWEAWDAKANDGAGGWVPVTDIFKIDTVYRATVKVQADPNHYMTTDQMIENYTINGKKAGEACIEDLDDWNNRPENVVTATVDEESETYFHPDWLPDGKVLYNNIVTFTYLFHTYETPTLQFSDEKGSWNEETPDPKVGTHHEPGQYVHHNEVVTEGDPGMTYLIAVNASVKDIFGAQVLLTNKELLDAGATLKIVQGNGTIDTALPVDEDRKNPMYKLSSAEFENEHDLIIYELTIPSSVTATKGLYHLEFQATGSTSLENLDAGKIDVAKSYYTFTLSVLEKQVPPVVSGGGTTVLEAPVVTYMLRNLGFTSDQTAEKITRKGAKPSFVPTITPVSGLKFLGWSEVDPATVKDGKLPELVDPLTFSISDDKVFYAVYEQIKYDHSHYVIGFPNGSFGPDANITRAEVATIIARSCLEGFVEGSDYGNPGNYSDASHHWAFSAISYCSLKGVFAGYEDGTFRPDRYISRQELATVVARLAGVQANQGLTFVDSGDVANWALNGVYTNVANGWVNGYEDNTFRPLNDITRAETVKIFNGYLNRGVDVEGLKNLHEYVHSGVASNNTENGHDEYMVWPDVAKSHWAYYEIIEAANDHNYTWRDGENGEKRTAPPENWNEAFIDERWRYDDNANDGADNRGDKVTEVTVTYMVKSDGVIWDSTTETVKVYESPSVEGLPTVRPNEGFRFAGWSETDPDTGVITLVDPTENYVTEDKIFYAVFEPDVPYEMPKVTITYVIGDKGRLRSGSLTEVIEMYQSPTVENLPRVTANAGYYFAGWSSTDPATGVVTILDPTENYVIEDKTFYAVFKVEKTQEMPTVTVIYVLGEYGFAEGAQLVQTVDLYESPSVEALPHVTAVEGYRFAGWSTIDPATGEHNEVDPTASYVTADITFYAVYETAVPGVDEQPQDPGMPVYPEEPSEIVIPGEPGEPVYPEEPGEPVYPEEPGEPVYPEEPGEPVYPEEPGEPVYPEEPGEPVYPEEPGEPVYPEEPGEPVNPEEPGEPVNPEEPGEPVYPEEPGEPVYPEEPSEIVDPVVYARAKYISGFEDGTFRPDAVITRAAVASIIANMNGYDANVTYDAGELSDLEGHWAKNVIAFCVEQGLMSGYEDGTFRPDRSMSRQELAVVLARMSGDVLSSEGLYFSDAADVADWAADGVYTACANGWMNGYEDGSFQPERWVTRAEAVKMFNAYLGRSADPERIEQLGGYIVLADVPETHWAYYEIIEASNNWLE